jgi:uncharacterized protein YbjQ (UPF0145 family)
VRSFAIAAGLLVLGVVSTAQARNTQYTLKIADVLQSTDFADKVGKNIPFYFGTQATPKVERTIGTFTTNRKTNSVGKKDEDACRWAMVSALLELRNRAEKEGGNAVINVAPFNKRGNGVDETDYECHAGDIIAGVALKGTVVKLAK